jgi:hypothetical protein
MRILDTRRPLRPRLTLVAILALALLASVVVPHARNHAWAQNEALSDQSTVDTLTADGSPQQESTVPNSGQQEMILKDVLVVPTEAIHTEGNQTWCFVKTEHGLAKRKVKLSQRDSQFVQVIDGVKAGEQVLLFGDDTRSLKRRNPLTRTNSF